MDVLLLSRFQFAAAYIPAGFFVMGISAYHLLKKQHIDFYTRSFKI